MAACEAYAMTRTSIDPQSESPQEMTGEEREKWAEKMKRKKEQAKGRISISQIRLRAAAQASLNYIMNVQHVGGGWRYTPKTQPGDTSHHGWMIRALHDGYSADLTVNPHTIKQASYFLDLVSHGDYKQIFWYMQDNEHGSHRATTAIGLLCRMYMGMDKRSGTIREGVRHLHHWGPDLTGNMYYNYFASHVLFQYGEEPWNTWNPILRDFLIQRQAKDGHEKGSWSFKRTDYGGAVGGRLYSTALAAITLEVYYAYPRIYRGGEE
jgi:hypothetical protein